jgi:hypothetical protein
MRGVTLMSGLQACAPFFEFLKWEGLPPSLRISLRMMVGDVFAPHRLEAHA